MLGLLITCITSGIIKPAAVTLMITSGITEPGFVPSDTKVRGFVTCLCSRWRRRPCRVTICTVSDVNKSYEAIPVYTCVKSKLDLATTLIAIVVVPSRVLSPVATHELFPSRVLAILVTHWCNRGGRYHNVSESPVVFGSTKFGVVACAITNQSGCVIIFINSGIAEPGSLTSCESPSWVMFPVASPATSTSRVS